MTAEQQVSATSGAVLTRVEYQLNVSVTGSTSFTPAISVIDGRGQ